VTGARWNIHLETFKAEAVATEITLRSLLTLSKEFFGLRHRVRTKFYLYSKMSPGWHSSALQIASRVDSRIAFALPFFKMEMFAIVMPTLSASSVTLIFRFANMTSMLIMMAMLFSLHR
jgi:hypothetical protein